MHLNLALQHAILQCITTQHAARIVVCRTYTLASRYLQCNTQRFLQTLGRTAASEAKIEKLRPLIKFESQRVDISCSGYLLIIGLHWTRGSGKMGLVSPKCSQGLKGINGLEHLTGGGSKGRLEQGLRSPAVNLC